MGLPKQDPAQGFPSIIAAVLTLVVLINSAAVAYGFYTVHSLGEQLRWISIVTTPLRATASEDSVAETFPPPASDQVRVEVFSDFACAHCRASASAIDSVRQRYGQRLNWRYRYVTRAPQADPLSFYTAKVGVCTESDGGPWDLYNALGHMGAWSKDSVEVAVEMVETDSDRLRSCVESDATEQRVWSDLFKASARGVSSTPTLFVNGVKVEGRISVRPLVQLIESEMAGLPQ